mmetsp:Transcript_16911/g.50636  ORF Transcript_16911/g.50636 Transcript_16911/m.50636 type:complete len:228 (-) Transcript_16911:265-948(-)
MSLSTCSVHCSPTPSNCSSSISLELAPLPEKNSLQRMMPLQPVMVKTLGIFLVESATERWSFACAPLGMMSSQRISMSILGSSFDFEATAEMTRASSPESVRTMAAAWTPRFVVAPVLPQTSAPLSPWAMGSFISIISSPPILLSKISSRARFVTGWQVGCVPWSMTLPASSAARCRATASSALHPIGVSLSTCLPACRALTLQLARTLNGVALYTASMEGSASSSS